MKAADSVQIASSHWLPRLTFSGCISCSKSQDFVMERSTNHELCSLQNTGLTPIPHDCILWRLFQAPDADLLSWCLLPFIVPRKLLKVISFQHFPYPPQECSSVNYTFILWPSDWLWSSSSCYRENSAPRPL